MAAQCSCDGRSRLLRLSPASVAVNFMNISSFADQTMRQPTGEYKCRS